MRKKYLCEVSENDSLRVLDLNEMLSSLRSLALVIAENDETLKQNSDLYDRLVTDYKQKSSELNAFWQYYLEKYANEIPPNTQLTLDYHKNIIYIIPLN